MTTQSAAQPTIAQLARSLGAAGVTLLTGRRTAAAAVTRAAMWEPNVELSALPGGLLLVPGSALPPPGLVAAAAEHGFVALLCKAFGADLADLVHAGNAHRVAVFRVDDALDWLQLDKLIANALLAVRDVEPGAATLAGGDLFALANAIAAAVGGATAIEDPGQRILAYSTLPDQPIDNDRRLGILGRQVPDGPENESQYRQVFRASGVVRLPPLPGGGYDRLAMPVRAGTSLLGSIWVIDAGTLIPDAEAYLRDVASLTSLQLLRARSAADIGRQVRADLLDAVLDDGAEPADSLHRLGFARRGPYRLAAVEPTDPGAVAGPALQQATDLAAVVIEARFQHSALTTRGGKIRILVGGAGADDRRTMTAALRHVVEQADATLQLSLHGAIGQTLTRAAELPGAARHAERVLELLRREPWRGPLASTRELENDLALHELESTLISRPELLAEAARDIVAYDREHSTSYAALLLTWFDAMRDTALTAKRLQLHPNTVRYRLGRVAALFGLDLHDPQAVLLTWLSLRALR